MVNYNINGFIVFVEKKCGLQEYANGKVYYRESFVVDIDEVGEHDGIEYLIRNLQKHFPDYSFTYDACTISKNIVDLILDIDYQIREENRTEVIKQDD